MARIAKEGLDYFPNGVDFLNERKMRRLMRKHGAVAAVTIYATLAATYGEKGYYLQWSEDVCFDLSEQANTEYEKVHAVIADAIHMEIFDAQMFKEQGVLTSEHIQKQYLACTIKRKNVVIQEKYRLISSPEYSSAVPNAPQTNIFTPQTPVCGTEIQQRKEKEKKAEESKEKQTSPIAPSEQAAYGGGEEPAKAGRKEEEDFVELEGWKIPRYCLNKQTHNCDGLLNRLSEIKVKDSREIEAILKMSNYGRIGHLVWSIISHTNWPKGNVIKMPGRYVLSQLKS